MCGNLSSPTREPTAPALETQSLLESRGSPMASLFWGVGSCKLWECPFNGEQRGHVQCVCVVECLQQSGMADWSGHGSVDGPQK